MDTIPLVCHRVACPMDELAYKLKVNTPSLFRLVERAAKVAVKVRYGRRLASVRETARLTGNVDGKLAEIRPLDVADLSTLRAFLDRMTDEHLRYFQPHGFDQTSLRCVLRSRTLLTYGLFVHDDLIAYGTLKISPTGAAYMGQLVGQNWAGRGLGRFLVGYLYWQASQANLRARSTISRENPASMKAHSAVANYHVCAELPNDYLMIEFRNSVDKPPCLEL